MSDTEKIMNAVEFFYNSQGYVDLPRVSIMVGIPQVVVANVISKEGFKESNRTGQWIKPLK